VEEASHSITKGILKSDNANIGGEVSAFFRFSNTPCASFVQQKEFFFVRAINGAARVLYLRKNFL